jgi:hypothetical protein
VVTAGLATTVSPIVVERPVEGFQLKFEAPDAINVVLVPLHIAGLAGVIVTTGEGWN